MSVIINITVNIPKLIREVLKDLRSCHYRWKVKDWDLVGWFSMWAQRLGLVWGSAGAQLIPSSPWCPLSILSGGKCNPRLAGPCPALRCLLSFVTSLHSFPHCKLRGLRRETLLHKTWRNHSCVCRRLPRGQDSGRLTVVRTLNTHTTWLHIYKTPHLLFFRQGFYWLAVSVLPPTSSSLQPVYDSSTMYYSSPTCVYVHVKKIHSNQFKELQFTSHNALPLIILLSILALIYHSGSS